MIRPGDPIRIANASGFYGDRFTAWSEQLAGGHLDVLTGDYLAELTMLILGRDRAKDPATGYAKTFPRQLETTLGTALDRGTKIVTNAGGVNPAGLAEAVRHLAATLGLDPKVAHVEGDDVRRDHPGALTANAYLGAFGIAECLRAGADVVVTGRVTDASLVVGPAAAHFGWRRDDLDALAGATAAGHVVECGAQATGGNFAFFTELPGMTRPGFPVAEVEADGSFVVTKHPGSGGAVTVETVTAQLLYEIDGPRYLGPDVVTLLDSLTVTEQATDRIRVTGARGAPPPPSVKVGVTGLGGYRNGMTFVLTGLDLAAKERLVRAQLTAAVGPEGLEFRRLQTDGGALLHVSLTDRDRRRAGRAFSAAAVELALASYPGCFLTAPPADATPYGEFTAAAMPQPPHEAVLWNGTRLPIPPPTNFSRDLGELLPAEGEQPPKISGETCGAPLGSLFGARSGDKGPDATLGVWARSDEAFAWLRGFLTAEQLRELLPEVGALRVERFTLPNLRAVGFVVRGLLGSGGVAASTLADPQAKALGERLRARIVDLPGALLPRVASGDRLVSTNATGIMKQLGV